MSPGSNGVAGVGGLYIYRLVFDLTGLDPSTALISGTFGTDNDGSIALNSNAPAAVTGFASFGGPTNFSFNSGFQPGLNSISVSVNNGGDPTAFRVEFSRATADVLQNPVPEPSSWALFTCGLAVFAAGHKRLLRRWDT